jgi:hypothetical protein
VRGRMTQAYGLGGGMLAWRRRLGMASVASEHSACAGDKAPILRPELQLRGCASGWAVGLCEPRARGRETHFLN